MKAWHAVEIFGRGFYVELVRDAKVLRTHPIGFNTQREAERAADRLNARDDDARRRWAQPADRHE